MQEQQLTITIDGRKGRVAPEDVVKALEAIPAMLRSIDAHMWAVEHPRFEWYIERATKKNPITITLAAILAIADAKPVDVVSAFTQGLRQLESDNARRPKYWDDETLAYARLIAEVARHAKSLTIQGAGDDPITPTGKIKTSADRLLHKAEVPTTTVQYGSVEGNFRALTFDQREGHRTSKFQIIDRSTGAVVECHFDPSQPHDWRTPSRVVAYGLVTTNADGRPLRIIVDDMRIIPTNLPTLRDLHDLELNLTGGMDAADFINELRDEDQ